MTCTRKLAVPAMNDSAPEQTGLLANVGSLAPALVARFPEVHDGVAASEHREAAVMVENVEPEPVPVEGNGGSHVPHRHRRNRLLERHHRRSSL